MVAFEAKERRKQGRVSKGLKDRSRSGKCACCDLNLGS